MKRTDGEYEGLAIDIYNRVKYELLKEGFIFDLIFEEVYTYGSKLPNGSWTGVIGGLTECDRARAFCVSLIYSRSIQSVFKPSLHTRNCYTQLIRKE